MFQLISLVKIASAIANTPSVSPHFFPGSLELFSYLKTWLGVSVVVFGVGNEVLFAQFA